jgi:hypothetical protein
MAPLSVFNVKASELRAELREAGWEQKFVKGRHERWYKVGDDRRTLEFTVTGGQVNPAGVTEVRKLLRAEAEQEAQVESATDEVQKAAPRKTTELVDGAVPEVDAVFLAGPKFLPRRSLGTRIVVTGIEADEVWAADVGPGQRAPYFVEAWDATLPTTQAQTVQPSTPNPTTPETPTMTTPEPAPVKQPVAATPPDWFKLTFNDRCELVARYVIASKHKLKVEDLGRVFRTDRGEVKRVLQFLVREGRITAEGHTKAREYMANPPKTPAPPKVLSPPAQAPAPAPAPAPTVAQAQAPAPAPAPASARPRLEPREASPARVREFVAGVAGFYRGFGRAPTVSDLVKQMKRSRGRVSRLAKQARTDGYLQSILTDEKGMMVETWVPTERFYAENPKLRAFESAVDKLTAILTGAEPSPSLPPEFSQGVDSVRMDIVSVMKMPVSSTLDDVLIAVTQQRNMLVQIREALLRVGWEESGRDLDDFLSEMKMKADVARKAPVVVEAPAAAPAVQASSAKGLNAQHVQKVEALVAKLDNPGVRFLMGRAPSIDDVLDRVLSAGIAAVEKDLG